jgi:hypothetical protein
MEEGVPENGEDVIQKILKKTSTETAFIRPKSLLHLICTGFELMIDQWKENIVDKTKNKEHMQGIYRIYKETKRRGAEMIQFD